jgi:YvrJ protein family
VPVDFIDFIKNVGFPIAVSIFVLVRLNGKMGHLADAMTTLTNTMQRFIEKAESAADKAELQDDARSVTATQKIVDAVRDNK